jgi:hypothetical protein
MPLIADAVRAALVPFLAVTGALLFALVCYVVVLHGVNDLKGRRRSRLRAAYRRLIDDALYGADAAAALERLRRAPGPHAPVIASLILEPLRVAEGGITDRAREAAQALGLVRHWMADVQHRRWWVRANAARALGLLKYRPAVAALIRALDDPFEDVRAAAVEALGAIRDESAIPELIVRLREQSRHQRVRLVQALRQFGSAAVPALLEHARLEQTRPDGGELPVVVELLGQIEAAAAADYLLECCGHPRAEVRAACVRAIGTIGVDDRAFYHVLRALSDDGAEVRSAAAWALGRSGRPEATAYLAPCLHDQWVVAAESARALRLLGDAGRAALESAAAATDGELARQMLWECGARSRA